MYQCCKFCLVWGPAWYNPNTSRGWVWEAFLWASAPLCIVRFCAIKVLHLLVAFLVWDTWRCSCLFADFDASGHTDANLIDWWLSCKSQRHTIPCMAQLPASRFFKRPMDIHGPIVDVSTKYSTGVPKQQGTNAIHPLRCDHLFAKRWRPSQASTGDLSHLDVSIHDALGGCRQVF